MKGQGLIIPITFAMLVIACSDRPKTEIIQPDGFKPTPIRTPSIPKNDDYKGRGKVTRIEMKGGSVEIDHEEIPGFMPAKKTEALVIDKSMLSGLKLGDEVNFTLRYNNGQETIIAISRSP